MFQHLRACLWLLFVTVLLCCVAYPLALLGIGKAFFPKQAEGSLIERDGRVVGSRLIAQPFTDKKYFQSRPSAATYNASASTGSNLSGNNYLLRDRVARQLGPITKYAAPLDKKGKPVGPDIDTWFQADKYQGTAGIVSQWSSLHSTVAQNWIKGDPINSAYVAKWKDSHAADVAAWVKDNPGTPEPKPEDLAGPFFADLSKTHPGSFLTKTDDSKDLKLTTSGDDIRAAFFDMWLTDHPDADLVKVPADAVMASGSGLDPHITLDNALWQLDNLDIASAWATETKNDEAKIREEIRKLIRERTAAPLDGLVGVPLVNVLELNLSLEDHFHPRPDPSSLIPNPSTPAHAAK